MGMASLISNFLRQFFGELRRIVASHKRAVVSICVISAVGFCAFVIVGYKVAETPWFCGSCHNMAPYIQSWKESKHHTVSCVECHYKPGLLNHLKGKFTDGQLSLVYFITGKGPSSPHAEISDESCIECHSKKDITSSPLDFKGVYFDHKHHLGSLRNGMQLRCTTCHSQIVQGEHLTVTESVCFQCHFYKTAENDPQRLCKTCHTEVKEVLTVNGIKFKHGEYIARGLDCAACHRFVIKGDGHVPPEKCVQCHNQREILETKYTHRSLHQNHVTLHKVECYVCHATFEHRIINETVGNPQTCDKCHPDSMHSPQQDLYLGKGGIGVEGNPFRMFQSHIDCSGCHARGAHEKGTALSSGFDIKIIEAGCIDCHGQGFDQMLMNWKRILAKAQASAEALVLRAEKAVAGATGEKGRKAQALVGEARYNYAFVVMAKGIHNIEYALRLLNVAEKKSVDAMALATGQKLQPVPDLKVGCAEMCHANVNQIKVKLVDAVFPHSVHVADQGLDCLECHTPRWNHGKTVMKNCNQCHHGEKQPACVNCHKSETDLYTGVGGLGVPDTPSFKIEAEVGCKDCHAEVLKGDTSDLAKVKARCVECHDDKMAAKADEWKAQAGVLLKGMAEKIAKARDLVEKADRRGINVDLLDKKVVTAEKNVTLVRQGNPIHNLKYAGLLIKQANLLLDEVIERLNNKLYG
ncbi:MAG: cytochrome c3 family protein [Deltaproteobacteria bacterium]|nr:cytochrome c3 family protein [Deltaproteobacteria bacterium]